VQLAGSVALDDDAHVEAQRERYLRRMTLLVGALGAAGYEAHLPAGTFYLWVKVPDGLRDGWEFADILARRAGLLVSPGDLYGPDGADHVRLAVVQPDDRLELVAERLKAS